MLKKRNKLFGILKLKCPRCREGNLFLHKNPYHLKMLDKMPKKCLVCGEDFERETGFYYGAMMISHASMTLIAVLVHLIVFHFYGWEIAPNLISITTIIIIMFPIIFRTSRAIWIGFFVRYRESKSK